MRQECKKYSPQSLSGYCLLAFCIALYAIIIQLACNYDLRIDFSSFYASAQALRLGHNPYLFMKAYFLPGIPPLPTNLNPPLFLWLISPLSHLSYPVAVDVWMGIITIVGILSLLIVFKIVFSRPFIQQYWTYLFSMGVLFYGTMMNIGIAQMGTFVSFFILAGYFFYQRQQDILAGSLWGIIIAIKFFPALLFFLALNDKRYRVLASMLLTIIVLSVIPWIVYGAVVYQNYFNMLPGVLWYGDSWNASFYGFLFRCWTDPFLWVKLHIKPANLFIIQIVYITGFSFGLSAYWYCLKKKSENTHHTICLTLLFMLLLSPLGWLYYFPVLLLPIAVIWQAYSQKLPGNSASFLLLLSALFLVSLPMDYSMAIDMKTRFAKAGIHSLYFYGLFLLTYLCINIPKIDQKIELSQKKIREAGLPVLIIILTSALWPALHAFQWYFTKW